MKRIVPLPEEVSLAFRVPRRKSARTSIPIMVGVHPSEGVWMPPRMQIALALNLKLLGNLLWKIQRPIGNMTEEGTVDYLLASNQPQERSFLFYDKKLKDTASTMAREVKRLVEMGVNIVSLWIDEEGLPHVIELLEQDKKEGGHLAEHVCGVAVLTSISEEECRDIHHMGRKEFLVQQTEPVAKLGMRHFISAVGEVQPVRANLRSLKLPQPQIHCPGIRIKDEDHGGQKAVATLREARVLEATSAIVERPIADYADVNARFELHKKAARER
jgi:orotidine-5'-phosphate decarboxylase